MSCNVTAIGENKEEFNKLKEDFGQYNALYTILSEETRTHVIEGFASAVEETNRVNAVTLMALNHIKDDISLLNTLDLANTSISESKLATLKEKVKSNLLGIINTAEQNYNAKKEANEDTSADSYIANRTYVLYKNLDQVFEKVVKNIKNLGFDTTAKEDKDTSDEDNFDEGEREVVEQIYGMSHLEKSPLESAKSIILLYLATQHKTKYNSRGEVVDVLDDLGMRVKLDLNETFANISKLLASKRTISEMISALTLKGVTDPLMKRIAIDLENNLMESDSKSVVNGISKYGFKAAFFSTFRKVYNTSLSTVVKKVDVISPEGEHVKGLSSKVHNANTRRLDNTIHKTWVQNSRAVVSLPIEKKKDAWERSVSKYLAFEDAEGRLNNPKDMEVLKAVQQLLKSMGMDVSIQTLQALRIETLVTTLKTRKSFYDIVMGKPAKGVSFLDLAKKFWAEGVDIYSAESTTTKFIAYKQSQNTTESSLQAFSNGKGNLQYPLNLPTSTTDLFDELSTGTGRASEFNTDPVYGNLRLIKLLANNEKSGIELNKFDSFKAPAAEDGAEFTEVSPLGSIVMRLNSWLNNTKDEKASKKGILLFPTPADKGNSSMITVPRMETVKISGNTILGGEFVTWAKDFAKSELSRINLAIKEVAEAKDKSELIENYHYNAKDPNALGNALQFNHFTALNQFLKKDGTSETVDFNSLEVSKALLSSIVDSFREDINYMIENKVLTEESTLENPVFTSLAQRMLPKAAQSKEFLHNFLANTLAVNTEVSTVFVADLAMFKPGKGQFADANKRAGLAETPGTKLFVDVTGAGASYNVGFIKDSPKASSVLSQINKILGVKESAYSSIDRTDGQGICTLDRYLDLQLGRGPVSKEVLMAIEELKKENPDFTKVQGVTFNPEKGSVHTLRKSDKFGRVMPQNLKYSVLPIYPAMFTHGGVVNQEMKALYDKMLASKIDEACFTTTAKIGAYNINSLEDAEFKSVMFNNEDYRIPQVVPYKTKTEQNAGSQVEKQIVGNVDVDGQYFPRYAKNETSFGVDGAISGKQLLDKYQEALIMQLAHNYNTTMDKFYGVDGTISEVAIAKEVSKAIESSSVSNTPSHILKALAYNPETNTTNVPLSFPTIKTKVESTLFSMFRKKVTKKTVPGFVGVQYTSLGYDIDKDSVKTSKSLKWVGYDESTGKVTPAEIICSPVYFLETLRKMPKTPKVEEAIKQLESGTFDTSKIDESLNEIVLYRIPYQGLGSSIPCKIVAFTPEASGVTITAPMELVTQAGIDFDIDKIYAEIKHFTINGENLKAVEASTDTYEGRNNTIIETHYAVLTNPIHLKEMTTPNNSDTLNKLMGEYIKLYGESKASSSFFGSLKTQESFRNEGKDGASMIGITADAATFHSLLGKWGATQLSRFSGSPIKINGKSYEVLPLGKKLNDFGELISSDYQEAMTASLDNAKVPILGNLNINSVTAPTFLWLLEAGAGLEYAIAVINTPIIRNLVKEVRNREQLYGTTGAFNSALIEVLGKGDYEKGSIAKTNIDRALDDRDFNITTRALKDLGANEADDMGNMDALMAFLTFKKYGDDLNNAKTAFKIDVKGAKQSIAENMILQQRLAAIDGTFSHERELEGDGSGLEVIPNPTFRIDKNLYRNHSIAYYESLGILRAIDLVSEVVLDNSPLFRDAVSTLQRQGVSRLNGDDLRMFFNDLYTSLICSTGITEEINELQRNLKNQNLVEQLLVGELSCGNKVLTLQAEERRKEELNPNYIPNKFLMSLNVELNKQGSFIDVVSFDNSVIKALSSDQKDDLSTEFMALLESELPEKRRVGINLVLYMFATEGFSRGINSYAELIPSTVFEYLVNPTTGNSVLEYFRDLENVAKQSEGNNMYLTEYVNNFLRNRATKLSSITDYSEKGKQRRPDFGLYVDKGKEIGDKVLIRVDLEDGARIKTPIMDLNTNRVVSGQFIRGVNISKSFTSNEKVTQQALELNGDVDTNKECNL